MKLITFGVLSLIYIVNSLAVLSSLTNLTKISGFSVDFKSFQTEAAGLADILQNNPKLEFPKWLSDFTGLHEWPELDPPYIPLDFVDFKIVPSIPVHNQTNCKFDMSACSFDCHNCVSHDDVYTCPVLSQTFDDGPSRSTLSLIRRLKTKTTFFTLGYNIVRFPEIYRETYKQGHIMGSHTWSHKFLPSLTNEQIVAQIEWSIWAMNATSGHLPKWFRPPYGGIDDRVRAILRQFGMQSVLWNFDTFDWKLSDKNLGRTKTNIYDDVKKFKLANKNQGLILEHDVLDKTVNVAIGINKILNRNQMTVPQCVGGIDYIKRFL